MFIPFGEHSIGYFCIEHEAGDGIVLKETKSMTQDTISGN